MTVVRRLFALGVSIAVLCGFAQDDFGVLLRELEGNTNKPAAMQVVVREVLPEAPPTTNLQDVVGGLPIECLIGEKKGAPVLGVQLDEIVLSSNRVTVAGTFTGSPTRKLTIDPVMFMGTLASMILSSAEVERPFRLVANDEYLLVDYVEMDKSFGRSSLFAGGGWPTKFSYSYEGFPSDDTVRRSKSHMEKKNIVSRFRKESRVRYFVKTLVGVRFWDQEYGYPHEDMTMVNLSGEGCCIMKAR